MKGLINRWSGLVLGLACVMLPAAQAAEDGVTEADQGQGLRTFSRLEGLFNVDLPQTVEKYDVRFLVRPHFGDFLNRSYLRIPFGVRLGVNDHTEINTELDSYATHGLRSGGEGLGFYAYHLGAKYQWLHWLRPDFDTSTGFNSTIPLSRPPPDLTDGLYHFSPYVVFSRRWENLPDVAPFVTFSTDLVKDSPVPGVHFRNQPTSDSLGIAPGVIWERGDLKYTLVTSFVTTSLVGHGNKNYYGINPSVLWAVPPGWFFGLSGDWVFGVGVHWVKGPDGTQISVSGKLRGEFNLSRISSLWRRDRE